MWSYSGEQKIQQTPPPEAKPPSNSGGCLGCSAEYTVYGASGGDADGWHVLTDMLHGDVVAYRMSLTL
ncbi:unnamed protein product [Ectocarpus sp. CCAP 1310/34]|nr:unnamed protein product [Ectocarpus sp. CCAP 1310/34]